MLTPMRGIIGPLRGGRGTLAPRWRPQDNPGLTIERDENALAIIRHGCEFLKLLLGLLRGNGLHKSKVSVSVRSVKPARRPDENHQT